MGSGPMAGSNLSFSKDILQYSTLPHAYMYIRDVLFGEYTFLLHGNCINRVKNVELCLISMIMGNVLTTFQINEMFILTTSKDCRIRY